MAVVKGKKIRVNDFIIQGTGYDADDPFIDDTGTVTAIIIDIRRLSPIIGGSDNRRTGSHDSIRRFFRQQRHREIEREQFRDRTSRGKRRFDGDFVGFSPDFIYKDMSQVLSKQHFPVKTTKLTKSQ